MWRKMAWMSMTSSLLQTCSRSWSCVGLSVGRMTAASGLARSRVHSQLGMSSSSSSSWQASSAAVRCGVSRLETLQELLEKSGAPGSMGCATAKDLVGISEKDLEEDRETLLRLHPHLYPIARSKSDPSNYVCALRRAFADDAEYQSSSEAPWPIVESRLDGFGYNLLALNSEHLMRRIVASHDDDDDNDGNSDILALYNEGLGGGQLQQSLSALDVKYETGSVAKLGYGPEKYILLRVGPFPDLYQYMAQQHAQRNDEPSSLIAAETANSKFPGFGSTFAFYARLLQTFPNRDDEAKDAARMCLRLPIPSSALTEHQFKDLAVLAQLAHQNDSIEQAIHNMKDMYLKIKDHEREDEQGRANMTPEQVAIEEANFILDTTAFASSETERDWTAVRQKLGVIYAAAGLDDMALFVDPNRS